MRRSACRSRSRTTSALMFDLLALAYQTDLTRVFTFMMAPRAQPADVSAHRRHRAAPRRSRTTQQRPANVIAAHAKVNTYHVAAVRQVPRAAAGDTGRRRLAARPLDDSLRQRHGQRQRPHAFAAADRARRRAARAGRTAHPARRTRLLCRTCSWHSRHRFGVDAQSFGISTGAVSL